MLAKIGKIKLLLRRVASRSEWFVWLLGLKKSECNSDKPGLIMIQIDGLSHTIFQSAIARNELPFLRKLLHNEHYQLHLLYSGLPSSTPAFQGELFYGIKGIVPAFSFRDHSTGKVVRMYQPEIASKIESILCKSCANPLLKNGSAYVDIYTGGANEAHFCPSALGWGDAMRMANPLVVIGFILSNIISFLRVFSLLFIEIFLSLIDFFRGIARGYSLKRELALIPARVAVSVLLRELTVIGVKMDVARGLPIIHLNFLGYDEQAHHRGPDSRLAHWALKGIDAAIEKIWNATQQSSRRHYDIWVHSDHGQEKSIPYEQFSGKSIQHAVSEAYNHEVGSHNVIVPNIQPNRSERIRMLGGNKIQRLFTINPRTTLTFNALKDSLTVIGMGPVCLVYTPDNLNDMQKRNIARRMVYEHSIPTVIFTENSGLLWAITRFGTYQLPEQTGEVFGTSHPFINEIQSDVIHQCKHANAGDFMLFGWSKGTESISFATEYGSHAGSGPQESSAFALLPSDAPLGTLDHMYLRPLDLYRAAHSCLKISWQLDSNRKERNFVKNRPLRIMTYNIHSAIGMDGKHSVDRIARVIARYSPDVIALQELDIGKPRSQGMDQAHKIAKQLKMRYHFHPTVQVAEEKFGDAILTHLPMKMIKCGELPSVKGLLRRESRGAIWVEIQWGNIELQVINTHLGLSMKERNMQIDALLGNNWIGRIQNKQPTILCGDFNSLPTSNVCKKINRSMKDAQCVIENRKPKATFYSGFPGARIDHVYGSQSLIVQQVIVPRCKLSSLASDHLPLIVDYQI